MYGSVRSHDASPPLDVSRGVPFQIESPFPIMHAILVHVADRARSFFDPVFNAFRACLYARPEDSRKWSGCSIYFCLSEKGASRVVFLRSFVPSFLLLPLLDSRSSVIYLLSSFIFLLGYKAGYVPIHFAFLFLVLFFFLFEKVFRSYKLPFTTFSSEHNWSADAAAAAIVCFAHCRKRERAFLSLDNHRCSE